MALNEFTLDEAIEICIAIRDKLELAPELSLEEAWREKDALAMLINFADEHKGEYENEDN